MAEFTWRPTYGAQVNMKPKVLEAAYGDGYVQRTPAGINSMPEEWDLTFSNLNEVTAQAIDTFLKTQGGYIAFDWKNMRGTMLKYVCLEWSTTFAEEDQSTVTAKFKQYFG